MYKVTNLKTVLNAVSSAKAGDPVYIGPAKSILALVSTDGSGTADFTLKFQAAAGNLETTVSDWETEPSRDNMWSYCQFTDISDNSTSSELSVSASDTYSIVKIEVPESVTYVNARITAISAGDVKVQMQALLND